MIRSVWSVLVGIVVLTVASFAIEAAPNPLLHWEFPKALPSPQELASNPRVKTLTFAYGSVYVAAGRYIAARIAGRRPVTNASVMDRSSGPHDYGMLSPLGSRFASRMDLDDGLEYTGRMDRRDSLQRQLKQ